MVIKKGENSIKILTLRDHETSIINNKKYKIEALEVTEQGRRGLELLFVSIEVRLTEKQNSQEVM